MRRLSLVVLSAFLLAEAALRGGISLRGSLLDSSRWFGKFLGTPGEQRATKQRERPLGDAAHARLIGPAFWQR